MWVDLLSAARPAGKIADFDSVGAIDQMRIRYRRSASKDEIGSPVGLAFEERRVLAFGEANNPVVGADPRCLAQDQSIEPADIVKRPNAGIGSKNGLVGEDNRHPDVRRTIDFVAEGPGQDASSNPPRQHETNSLN